MCVVVVGANCSERLREHHYHMYRLPVRCEVALDKHHPHVAVHDLVNVQAEFNVASGTFSTDNLWGRFLISP